MMTYIIGNFKIITDSARISTAFPTSHLMDLINATIEWFIHGPKDDACINTLEIEVQLQQDKTQKPRLCNSFPHLEIFMFLL